MQKWRDRMADLLVLLAMRVGGPGWLVPIMREQQDRRRASAQDHTNGSPDASR